MAQDTSDHFSQLWQRHLTTLRDDFSATSIQALPSLPSCIPSVDGDGHGAPECPGHAWHGKVDALDDLTSQSPITADTHSPETPLFPDREGYTETALSSPENASWPKTARGSKGPGLPYLAVGEYQALPPEQTELKGKELDLSPDGFIGWRNHTPHNPCSLTTATALQTPTVTTPQKGPPTQVHVLMLTWAKHPSSNPGTATAETETLRSCLKLRGYRVHCRLIPTDYPTAAVETLLDKFLDKSAADSLLVVYYQGYGNLDGDGRMVFSSPAAPNASTFVWDDVRDPVMQSPGDVLLVFDCTALPGTRAEQREIMMRIEAGTVLPSSSTKQLLGVCVPLSASGDGNDAPGHIVTRSLRRVLERMGDESVLSAQRLCSLMREDLRGTGLASRVFVSQLGGGQLLDIYLPTVDRGE